MTAPPHQDNHQGQQHRQNPHLTTSPFEYHALLIPELRDPITLGLTFQDHVRCSHVSRLWHRVFAPYVFQSITASSSSSLSARSRFPADLSRQGRHVRHLDLTTTTQAELVLDRIRTQCLFMDRVRLSCLSFYEDQFEMHFMGIPPLMAGRPRQQISLEGGREGLGKSNQGTVVNGIRVKTVKVIVPMTPSGCYNSNDHGQLRPIPHDVPNGFLSETIQTLQLQIPTDTFLSAFLWLTRAGLDGRLQGMKTFELSSASSSAVNSSGGDSNCNSRISAGAIHDFLAVYPGLTSLLLQDMVIAEDRSNEGMEPDSMTATRTGYLADLKASVAIIRKLTSRDASVNFSQLSRLSMDRPESLAAFRSLLHRLPHLNHLTFQQFGNQECLKPIQECCPDLVSLTFLDPPRNNAAGQTLIRSIQGLGWGSFLKSLVHLQEIRTMNAVIVAATTLLHAFHWTEPLIELRTILRDHCSGLRVVQISGMAQLSWQGGRVVLESCPSLEECTLTCVGPVDGFFLERPPAPSAFSPQGQEITNKDIGDVWPSFRTLQVLNLHGMAIYHLRYNLHLHRLLRVLKRLRILTITGRGLTLEAVLGAVANQEDYDEVEDQVNDEKEAVVELPCLESVDLPRLAYKLNSSDLELILERLPRLKWMDIGGAYTMEAMVWLETCRRDLLATFSR